MIYESGEETRAVGEKREPFHKIRITACRTTVRERERGEGGERERLSIPLYETTGSIWSKKKKRKKNARPFNRGASNAACEKLSKKRDGQACPKFDAGSQPVILRRWSCRIRQRRRWATLPGACTHIGVEKNNRWKFVVRATWRPNWYNNKNGAFQRYHAGEFSFICKCDPAATL